VITLKQIDCSHGNSQKVHSNQPKVAEDIVSISLTTRSCGVTYRRAAHDCFYLKARQLEQSETAAAIMGVMLESNLVEGTPSKT
jgi:3-deoxy-7-phosphoheptulonate synthase